MGDNSRPPATTLWPGVGGRQALINVGDNIAGPWSGVPPTPGMACLLPLVWPASYPWSVLPPTPGLSCLLSLVCPASYPWSGLSPTPGLACLLPLVWPASYPWSGLPPILGLAASSGRNVGTEKYIYLLSSEITFFFSTLTPQYVLYHYS